MLLKGCFPTLVTPRESIAIFTLNKAQLGLTYYLSLEPLPELMTRNKLFPAGSGLIKPSQRCGIALGGLILLLFVFNAKVYYSGLAFCQKQDYLVS